MSTLRKTLIGIVAVFVAFILIIVVFLVKNAWYSYSLQSSLDPFYISPEEFSEIPGTLVRFEPLGVEVADAQAYRMLYVTEDSQGNSVVAAGMAFIPDKKSATPRPVLAYAAGTTGQGDECAPSRSANPIDSLKNFLPEAITQGWAVVAPDEYGVGTEGTQLYLNKEQEVRDTVYSIRALQSIPGASAGNDFAVYGYSQGGHTALWTGLLSEQFAPELNLVGVAAVAPAANLTSIVERQWDEVAGWGIGADIVRSWQVLYPNLFDGLLHGAARINYERLAQQCTFGSFVEGTIRHDLFKQDFFSENPAKDPLVAQLLIDQTPTPFPAELPLMLVQGTADQIVLAGPNADLQEDWCAAGSTVNALWLGGVDHTKVASMAGPLVTGWIADRFAGRIAPNTCDTPPPRSLITVQ
jgi:predicted esterase